MFSLMAPKLSATTLAKTKKGDINPTMFNIVNDFLASLIEVCNKRVDLCRSGLALPCGFDYKKNACNHMKKYNYNHVDIFQLTNKISM